MYKLLVPLLVIAGCTEAVQEVQPEKITMQQIELNSLMNKIVYAKDKKGLCYAIVPYRTTGGSTAYSITNVPQNTCGE